MLLATKTLITLPLIFAYFILLSSMVIVFAGLTSLTLVALSRQFRSAIAAGSAIPPTIVEICVMFAMLLFIVVPYIYYAYWQDPSTYLWNNSFLVGVMVVAIAGKAFHMTTDNPFVRRTTQLVVAAPLSLMIVLPIAYFLPDLIAPSMIKWAVIIAAAIVLLQCVVAGLRTVPRLRRFEEIMAQNREATSRLDVLQRVIAMLAGTPFGDQLVRLLKSAQGRQAEALYAAKRNALDEADNANVVCRIEIAEIDRKLDESAPQVQELTMQRLRQLRDDIRSLGVAYRERQLSASNVDSLEQEAQTLSLSWEAHDLWKTAKSFDETREKLDKLTGAMRFRDNLDSELALREADLLSYAPIIELCRALNLNVNSLETSMDDARQAMDKLRNRELSNINDLPNWMQNVEAKI
jgi:hypothetical protein